jgi:hypothetical protein
VLVPAVFTSPLVRTSVLIPWIIISPLWYNPHRLTPRF